MHRYMMIMTFLILAFDGAVAEPTDFTWPTQWQVFAPFDRDDPLLPAEQLRQIPEQIPTAEGEAIAPRQVVVAPGERLDLQTFFPSQQIGNVAWVFTTLTSDSARPLTIGMGADWWFTAWLNGAEVLATPPGGNSAWPPSPKDFTTEVQLQPGDNVLAVRIVTGSASALFAAGGPAEITAAQGAIGGDDDPRRFNRPIPFTERLPFDLDAHGFAAAEQTVAWPAPPDDLAEGALVGLQPLPKRQLQLVDYHGRPEVHDTEYRRFPFDPVKLLLSKVVYPAEDTHLDVVLWTSPPEGIEHTGELEVLLRNAEGAELVRRAIDSPSETGWFFSLGLPPVLIGQSAELTVIWRQGEQEIGRANEVFQVRPPVDVATSGRIPIRLLNEPGATIAKMPFTVGVPFPRGALSDERQVRLLDEDGHAIPLQTSITSRWSRFGSIRWLLCDFTADLTGQPRTLTLEYGPTIDRPDSEPFTSSPPMTPEALRGAFVEHENGKRFTMPAQTAYTVETEGNEKRVLRANGWYVHEATGERFCNYVIRLVQHRDSPILRLYHTWIFTGDGNNDRIRAMGWRFPMQAPLSETSFPSSFDNTTWLEAPHLVQFDFARYLLGSREAPQDGRLPGVLKARADEQPIYFGVKDFWQNFPSELAFEEDAFVFYNWPRHNPPAYTERPYQEGQAFRLRYAHEGELLDFTTPDEYLTGPIWNASSINGQSIVWPEGDRAYINAQGVARTEEMLLYQPQGDVSPDDALKVMQGLNDESIRAVADPEWMVATGVFGRIHHQDRERFPREESLYEEICHAPHRWVERLGAYGMWLYGDFPADGQNLRNARSSSRRTWKKGHHGWPYKWTPYARSGDPTLLKYAEAATRQMIDGNFKHYVSTEVSDNPEEDGPGWTGTSLFPWLRVANRSISQDVDHLWHSYYLTGYQRARDVALYWQGLAQLDTARCLPGRISISQMHYYLDTWKATFDPWFLIASHEIGRLHQAVWDSTPRGKLTTETVGHFWKPAEYDYFRYAGRDTNRRMATAIATSWCSPWAYTNSWNRLDVPYMEEAAAAWFLTGDRYYLQRLEGYLDSANIQVHDAPEPPWMQGSSARHGGAGTALELFTGWYIQHFPLALGAIVDGGERLPPIPEPFFQRPTSYTEVTVDGTTYDEVRPPRVLFQKPDGPQPLFLDTWWYRDLVYDVTIGTVAGEPLLATRWTSDHKQWLELDASPAALCELQLHTLDPNTGWKAPGSQFVSGLIRLPVTPPEIPEVVAFEQTEEGTRVGSSLYETQYWFHVPADLSEFWLELDGTGAKIWDPAGDVVWDDWRQPADGRVTIPVPPEHAGQLWRITRPGPQQGFTLDPRIPPYLSVSRAKWFRPQP